MICGGVNISITDPRVKAFLDLIARAEGTYHYGAQDGYNILYGFGTFNSYAQHPNIVVNKGGLRSTAAGRYQILKKTWDGVKSSIGASDFSPANQDKAAFELLRRRGALDKLSSNDIQGAINSANNEWASFPGSPYGQGTRSMAQMLSWYSEDLAKYQGGNSDPVESIAAGAIKISNMLSEAGPDLTTIGIASAVIVSAVLIYNYS